MWEITNTFLNDIAESQGYDRESLSLVADVCSGGPTIQPNTSQNKVDKSVTAGPNVAMPYACYDNLGSKHMEYRVIHTIDNGGKTQVPMVLYSFQLHPLPGCCGFAVNRWVRCNDNWPKKLQTRAMNFRKDVAYSYGYTSLFVSKGASGYNSGELYESFKEIFHNEQQTLYGISTV